MGFLKESLYESIYGISVHWELYSKSEYRENTDHVEIINPENTKLVILKKVKVVMTQLIVSSREDIFLTCDLFLTRALA